MAMKWIFGSDEDSFAWHGFKGDPKWEYPKLVARSGVFGMFW
jgi:hypothetical protein